MAQARASRIAGTIRLARRAGLRRLLRPAVAPRTLEGTHVGTILRLFRPTLTQSEERKDRHNDDNQSDQIDNIVHTSLPNASSPAWARLTSKQRKAHAIVP